MKRFKKEAQTYAPETLEEVLTYPIQAIPERGISQKTCEVFGVRTKLSEETGKPEAYYFPGKKDGKITSFKKRDLRYSKKRDEHWSVIGESDITNELFGQDTWGSTQALYLTEGELDAMFLYETLVTQQQNPGQYMPSVGSIGFGTKNAAEHIANNLEAVERYKEVRITFDSDTATPAEARKGVVKGREATGDACLLLGARAKVIYLDKKDPCEYKENPRDLYWLAVKGAKEYEPDTLIRGGVGLDALLAPLQTGVYIKCLPKTMDLIKGLRPGELTLILAPTNVGKSTICREIQYDLINSGASVANYFIEEEAKKTQQAMLAMDNNVFLPKFRADPTIIPYEKAADSYARLVDNGNTLWVDTAKTFGKLTPKEFIKSLKWANAMGAKYAILDHISMIFSASEADNERKEIDHLLTELAAFVTTTQMHVIVVSHIKRVPFTAPKDKEGNVKYPYWLKVDKDAGRGSGSFEQLCHNLIILEPEVLQNEQRGRLRTKVAKNREWSYLGIGDVLQMHPVTGRLISADTQTNSY